MMSLTFGLFTQVSGSGPLGPLVWKLLPPWVSKLLWEKVKIISFLETIAALGLKVA